MNKIIVTNNAWSKLISIIKNSNNNSFMLSASSGDVMDLVSNSK